MSTTGLFFSDYFRVDPQDLEQYGAFDISLVSDLPLFIDPFLLFNSEKDEYKKLHEDIIRYLKFLRDRAKNDHDPGTLKNWYMFQEVKQNWFGFSAKGNKGSALGMSFARALNENLYKIFQEFGGERVTRSSHLEKLCLIRGGVGRDNISDFATNLIKEFLLEYTQTFTQKYISEDLRREFRVRRTRFNYETQDWAERAFVLPIFKDDFVILTPKDLLTKDETWINRNDLLKNFDSIPDAVDNDELRSKANNYFQLSLSRYGSKPKDSEKKQAAAFTILKFPELIDHYIKLKEESGEQAKSISDEKVRLLEGISLRTQKLLLKDYHR